MCLQHLVIGLVPIQTSFGNVEISGFFPPGGLFQLSAAASQPRSIYHCGNSYCGFTVIPTPDFP